MASKTSDIGIAKMIVQYEWILEDVEEEPKTIASKMILFRGQKVFRVGLKNHEKSPILFFMAIDLNKIGMRVEGVMYGIQDSGISPATMTTMTKEKIGVDGNLQLFMINLAEMVTGNRKFVFRIHIEGSASSYSYHLSDRLAKDQLWATVTGKNQNSVDVEFFVKGKTFSAHKAILAARSPVFAAIFAKEKTEEREFTPEQPALEDSPSDQIEPSLKKRKEDNDPSQIQIYGVEPSAVIDFLYFIYTGESIGTLANEELLKLADLYQLSTLSSLCQNALKKIKPLQMVNIVKNLNKEFEIASSKIRLEKEAEIVFDRTTPTFRCAWTIDISENQPSKSVMQYQKEDICFAYFTGKKTWNGSRNFVNQPVIHFSCAQHCRFGLKVEDIYFKHGFNKWFKMESKNFQKNAELLHYTTQPKGFACFQDDEVYFNIKIVNNIGNYHYEMMDDTWIKDFWLAATKLILTDVDIFVGTVKVMEAHRVILSARSPVLNASLSYTGKAVFTFDGEFDAVVVKHFLKFLYTGSLETSNFHKQLLKLATLYEVETLVKICKFADRVPDVEELTSCLLQP